MAKDVNFLASYTSPLGPGNNYFDNDLNYSRKPVYSIGLGWDINSKIVVEGKLTNSFGATPDWIANYPTDNQPLYSANITYKPYGEDTYLTSK